MARGIKKITVEEANEIINQGIEDMYECPCENPDFSEDVGVEKHGNMKIVSDTCDKCGKTCSFVYEEYDTISSEGKIKSWIEFISKIWYHGKRCSMTFEIVDGDE